MDIGVVLIIVTLIGLFFAGVSVYIWYKRTPETIIHYIIYLVLVFIIWIVYCIIQLS